MKHWTENDFQKWLYGLKEQDSHLQTCSECRIELERLHAERQRIIAAPEVSEEFLTAQRRNIYNRLNQTSRNFAPLRWALSVTMVLLVVVGLTLPRFKQSAVILTNDEQLYSDLAAMEQTDEPKAIQPLHKLFEK
jgi:predicted anti-sigma-YlaC factor YlaD